MPETRRKETLNYAIYILSLIAIAAFGVIVRRSQLKYKKGDIASG